MPLCVRLAPTVRSLDHFLRKIDADDAIANMQKRGAHKARPTAGVEHEASLRQVGCTHEPRDCCGIALDRRRFKLGGL